MNAIFVKPTSLFFPLDIGSKVSMRILFTENFAVWSNLNYKSNWKKQQNKQRQSLYLLSFISKYLQFLYLSGKPSVSPANNRRGGSWLRARTSRGDIWTRHDQVLVFPHSSAWIFRGGLLLCILNISVAIIVFMPKLPIYIPMTVNRMLFLSFL